MIILLLNINTLIDDLIHMSHYRGFNGETTSLCFCVLGTLYCYSCSLTRGKLYCPDDGIEACGEGQVDIQTTLHDFKRPWWQSCNTLASHL